MSKPIKVAIAGINGKMGKATAKALIASSDFKLVGAFGKPQAPYVGKDIGQLIGQESLGIKIANDFPSMLSTCNAGGQPDIDVLLVYSIGASACEYALAALEQKIAVVVGSSGLQGPEFEKIRAAAKIYGTGALVIPNFSLGAVLMMEFASLAARYFSDVEVVEMHGPSKVDAPSGTAMYTTNKLNAARTSFNTNLVESNELIKGSRGGTAPGGVRVHSLRLPGPISHQEVIFGGTGELLKINHDSYSTDCFLKGIFLSLSKAKSTEGLVIGLENLIDLSTAANTSAAQRISNNVTAITAKV
jgi:4-hydroxy-tetrahydrodipicolinate reductase